MLPPRLQATSCWGLRPAVFFSGKKKVIHPRVPPRVRGPRRLSPMPVLHTPATGRVSSIAPAVACRWLALLGLVTPLRKLNSASSRVTWRAGGSGFFVLRYIVFARHGAECTIRCS